MLLIFISWCYLFITAVVFGIFFKRIFRIENSHIVIHLMLGLFFFTLITSISAIFSRISIGFYLAVFLLNISLIIFRRGLFIQQIKLFTTAIKQLRTTAKFLFIAIFVLTLAQSATSPYLVDNETYYIQTIQWINEFGFVKGLANLQLFLGQNSAWHTLQAGFNFSFISEYLNDINGFLYVLISLLALEKIQSSGTKSDEQSLCFGLILLFTPVLMQFVNSPSPDLPVFIIAPYIFYLFIRSYNSAEPRTFKILLSLILFLCLIKITAALLLILAVVLYFKHFNHVKKDNLNYVILGCLVLSLFIIKNSIISGYPLYPITSLEVFNFDWKQPEALVQFQNLAYLAGFDYQNVAELSHFQRWWIWINLPKLHGLFNKVFMGLLIIFPWVIYKSNFRKALTIIYVLAILQFLILWNYSPQYRFFFFFVIFLSIQVAVVVLRNKKIWFYLISGSIILGSIPVFISLDLSTFTKNKQLQSSHSFKAKNIFFPEKNSKTITEYQKENVLGFEFYSPSEEVFFWVSGNGKLPCVNKKQIDYIQQYFNYIPQQRSPDLKDGFRSKKLDE